tara:strand:- start:715 stop:1326 length:612 start_codon:yes stop_codon:yes gene_type:complete
MDYSQGKIYKIITPHCDKYYIGSTITSLSERFSKHKYEEPTTAKQLIQLGDCSIELIENFPCQSKKELTQREGELQRKFKNEIVNCKIEGRTKKEYYEDNKETIINYIKNYRIENIEKVKAQQKSHYNENREVICEKVKNYVNKNREKVDLHKKNYYVKNKKELLEYQEKYRAEHKEKINARNKLYREKKKAQLLSLASVSLE